MEGERKLPFNLRSLLLAFPKKGRVTKKYTPPVYIPGSVESGVKPGAIKGETGDNWRINMLSEPFLRNKTEKYVYVPVEGETVSGISPSTLAGQGSSRSNDLSKPILRYLVQNKRAFNFLGKRFIKHMDKRIQESWNCIYNHYKKCKKKKLEAKKLAAKKSKSLQKDQKGKPVGKAKSEKEIKEEIEKRITTRCLLLSKPKIVHRPKPPERKKIADLAAMAARLAQMSEPTQVTKKYLRPSIDPTYVDPNKVADAAKTYEPTERVLELARCPPHRLMKVPVFKPGAVKRSALTCIVSPRFGELAVPRKKAAEVDNDLKENPFAISKNAMKYVASARIQELAKPTERN